LVGKIEETGLENGEKKCDERQRQQTELDRCCGFLPADETNPGPPQPGGNNLPESWQPHAAHIIIQAGAGMSVAVALL